MEGIIIKGIGGFYTVVDAEKGVHYTLRAQKKLRRQGMTPFVGDKVRFIPGLQGEDGWIEQIFPRKNEMIRPNVANIDVLMAVLAPVPEPDLYLIEKLVFLAHYRGMQPIICVNKTDIETGLPERIEKEYGNSLHVFAVSTKTGNGIDQLRSFMEGKVTCMAGQSAVGKTSLLNAIFDLSMETGLLSIKTERGKHTTRRAELFCKGKAFVVDTPGFSLLEMDGSISPDEVANAYGEYRGLSHSCRFQPCLHNHEPGCAVRAAVESGILNQIRWDRYRRLLSEVSENWKGRYR